MERREGQLLQINRIDILRLDHRVYRDQRITTHVALTARTLGASSFTYTGEKDDNMEKSITDVVSRWGGSFTVCYSSSTRRIIQEYDGIVIHLTMYGERHHDTIKTLDEEIEGSILVILGGAKVPRYVYELADFNTAIGSQPHSEVAAVAIFLHELLGDDMMYTKYDGASAQIVEGNSKSRRSDRFQASSDHNRIS